MKKALLIGLLGVFCAANHQVWGFAGPEAEGPSGESLMAAIAANDVDKVKFWLKAGADVNFKRHWATPLHIATRGGHENIVKTLLDSGAKVNLPDGAGLTALHWAARNGYEDIAAMLLDANAGVDLKDNNGNRALHFAARNGYKVIVQMLLDAKAGVNLQEEVYGRTPLHSALYTGLRESKVEDKIAGYKPDHIIIANKLFAAGANPLIKDKNGHTALDGLRWRVEQVACQSIKGTLLQIANNLEKKFEKYKK